jgi:hypothetical protein
MEDQERTEGEVSNSTLSSWRVVGELPGEESIYSSWMDKRTDVDDWLARRNTGGHRWLVEYRMVTTRIFRGELPHGE